MGTGGGSGMLSVCRQLGRGAGSLFAGPSLASSFPAPQESWVT